MITLNAYARLEILSEGFSPNGPESERCILNACARLETLNPEP